MPYVADTSLFRQLLFSGVSPSQKFYINEPYCVKVIVGKYMIRKQLSVSTTSGCQELWDWLPSNLNYTAGKNYCTKCAFSGFCEPRQTSKGVLFPAKSGEPLSSAREFFRQMCKFQEWTAANISTLFETEENVSLSELCWEMSQTYNWCIHQNTFLFLACTTGSFGVFRQNTQCCGSEISLR